jgi:hypothetical protein
MGEIPNSPVVRREGPIAARYCAADAFANSSLCAGSAGAAPDDAGDCPGDAACVKNVAISSSIVATSWMRAEERVVVCEQRSEREEERMSVRGESSKGEEGGEEGEREEGEGEGERDEGEREVKERMCKWM